MCRSWHQTSRPWPGFKPEPHTFGGWVGKSHTWSAGSYVFQCPAPADTLQTGLLLRHAAPVEVELSVTQEARCRYQQIIGTWRKKQGHLVCACVWVCVLDLPEISTGFSLQLECNRGGSRLSSRTFSALKIHYFFFIFYYYYINILVVTVFVVGRCTCFTWSYSITVSATIRLPFKSKTTKSTPLPNVIPQALTGVLIRFLFQRSAADQTVICCVSTSYIFTGGLLHSLNISEAKKKKSSSLWFYGWRDAHSLHHGQQCKNHLRLVTL